MIDTILAILVMVLFFLNGWYWGCKVERKRLLQIIEKQGIRIDHLFDDGAGANVEVCRPIVEKLVQENQHLREVIELQKGKQKECDAMQDVVELARTLKKHLLEPICGGAMSGMSDKRRRMYRDLMIELEKLDALKGGDNANVDG